MTIKMTRAHCARRLLALGPLRFSEFLTITGWTVLQCSKTLGYMRELGELDKCGLTYSLVIAKNSFSAGLLRRASVNS